MASLIVRKPDGSVLFDTQYITHGLVKSGYLQPDETWGRYYLRSINLDPNDGASYTQSTTGGDQMFSITVGNAVNPICFIVGKGCLQGTARSGNTVKFFYNGGDTSTKAYVFDLMNDNVAGSKPWLKTRRADGSISFNSLQVPLNILYTVQTPAPAELDQYGRYKGPYAGGAWQSIVLQSQQSPLAIAHYVVDIALPGGVEYAAFLNYSRGATGYWAPDLTGVNPQIVSMSEGAYGRVGGMSFMFGPAGGGTNLNNGGLMSIPGSMGPLITDRYPLALVIATTVLPFPYG
jgi:hypothetical protein